MNFEGRAVVVTGGTGALGQGVVEFLLDAGAICHVVDRRSAEETRFALSDHERVVLHTGVDLADEPSVTAVYAGIDGLWASIHVAGGFAMAPLLDNSLADLERMVTINLVTSFLCCREATRALRRTGGGGRLVNIVARPALIPTGGMVSYCTSKGAVAAMTGALSEELRGEGIFVNAVAPSIIDTAANRAAMPLADHSSWPSPAELAATICFLASPQNRATSGGLVPVYGSA